MDILILILAFATLIVSSAALMRTFRFTRKNPSYLPPAPLNEARQILGDGLVASIVNLKKKAPDGTRIANGTHAEIPTGKPSEYLSYALVRREAAKHGVPMRKDALMREIAAIASEAMKDSCCAFLLDYSLDPVKEYDPSLLDHSKVDAKTGEYQRFETLRGQQAEYCDIKILFCVIPNAAEYESIVDCE